MPAKSRDDWFSQHAPAVQLTLKNRLYQSSALQAIAGEVAAKAMERTRERHIDDVAGVDDYFAPVRVSRRWLLAAAYCEALRILPRIEPIHSAIQGFLPDTRQLLYWSYIDQLSTLDVAQILGLESVARTLFDEAAACQQMTNAYEQLCLLLQRRFPARNFLRGRIREYGIVFPSPPTLTQALLPEKKS